MQGAQAPVHLGRNGALAGVLGGGGGDGTVAVDSRPRGRFQRPQPWLAIGSVKSKAAGKEGRRGLRRSPEPVVDPRGRPIWVFVASL